MNSINEIKEMIKTEISKYKNIEVEDNINLFSNEYNIFPRDIVYIIIQIEKKLGYKVTDIFRSNDCNIMTVNNLANAIQRLQL